MQDDWNKGLHSPTINDARDLLRLCDGLHTTAASGRVARLVDGLLGMFDAALVRAYVGRDPPRGLTLCAEAFGPTAGGPTADWAGRAVPPEVGPGAYAAVTQTAGEPVRLASVRAGSDRVTVLAAWREAAFGPRDVSLLELLHAETAWVFDTALARAGLPRGTEAVLDLMLVGLPEKEIARKLDRNFHTVHSHVKRVYKHFAVTSRPELIARLYDRRPDEPRAEPAADDAR